ncbi:MAG: hypothetical protein POH28_08285 [Acidocella sp.]|nr:hypothetical protein [Acidocella sp.]
MLAKRPASGFYVFVEQQNFLKNKVLSDLSALADGGSVAQILPRQKRHNVALHWDNIDPRMVYTQAEVFRHLGYVITQTCQNGLSHGAFLDRTFATMSEDDLVRCMDIDCLPTNSDIVEHAFAVAEAGGLIGCAQVSMHIDPMRIFTAPCFLALSRRSWDALGRPSFCPDTRGDVGQVVHDAALAAGIEVEYIRPWVCALPKWNLADQTFLVLAHFTRVGCSISTNPVIHRTNFCFTLSPMMSWRGAKSISSHFAKRP